MTDKERLKRALTATQSFLDAELEQARMNYARCVDGHAETTKHIQEMIEKLENELKETPKVV